MTKRLDAMRDALAHGGGDDGAHDVVRAGYEDTNLRAVASTAVRRGIGDGLDEETGLALR